MLQRTPRPSLRPFVKVLWATHGDEPVVSQRERVLPTGGMNLAFRVSDDPLRIYAGPEDREGRTIGLAVVGGARAEPYIRDVSRPVRSIGVALQPGAAPLLLGVPAHELAGRHTSLEDLWGKGALEIRERLAEAGTPERQLDLLEAVLAARLPRACGIHPAVAHAVERFSLGADVGSVVARCGWSHRRFIVLFRESVGLTPKVFARVARFQRTVQLAAQDRKRGCVDLALDGGYSDQPHFNREFRAMAGLTPGRYRALAPAAPNHVPIPG
jgi:AraC-like DNA-binding protein